MSVAVGVLSVCSGNLEFRVQRHLACKDVIVHYMTSIDTHSVGVVVVHCLLWVVIIMVISLHILLHRPQMSW